MGGEEGLGVTTGQPNLYKQDLSKLDVSKLTALSREVISRQATINIGTIGHVAHGKSTIVKAISGVQTVRFKNELERNITIKLDARAVECGSEGRQETHGRKMKMLSSTYEKRRRSSGSNQPRTKKPRSEEVVRSSKDQLYNSDAESTLSSASTSTSELQIKQEEESNTEDCHDYSDSEKLPVAENIRLNSDDVVKTRLNYNLGGLKLKELRIILEDIRLSDRRANETDLWEVEQILGKKERNGVPMYLIKWKNWSTRYNTWEPVSNLVNCTDMLKGFESESMALLKEFKERTEFYPDAHDVQQYMKSIQHMGEPLDFDLVTQQTFYTNVRDFLKQKHIRNKKLESAIKVEILRMLLYGLRREQTEALQNWEDEMNLISKGKPEIHVENFVDLEGPPTDFYYIEEYLPGAGVFIPDDPPIGCDCKTCGAKEQCCFAVNDNRFPYTSTSKVRVPPGTPIYECNKRCTCDITCQNRVVQRGANMKLCIFRTDNDRGWGVKTLKSIKKGTFVTQYVGEVITSEEADKRGKEYDAAGRTYLFDLDYNDTEDQCPYTVDAAMYGNISHFINHSCDPNLAVYGIWINCLDPNLPKIALFATRDIKANEEITFDYMCQSSKNNDSISYNVEHDIQKRENMETELKLEVHDDRPVKKTLCKCGAETCRRYLF